MVIGFFILKLVVFFLAYTTTTTTTTRFLSRVHSHSDNNVLATVFSGGGAISDDFFVDRFLPEADRACDSLNDKVTSWLIDIGYGDLRGGVRSIYPNRQKGFMMKGHYGPFIFYFNFNDLRI